MQPASLSCIDDEYIRIYVSSEAISRAADGVWCPDVAGDGVGGDVRLPDLKWRRLTGSRILDFFPLPPFTRDPTEAALITKVLLL